MFGSGFWLRRTPNVTLLDGPISFSSAMSSWLRSFHVRWSVEKTAGLYVEANPGPCDCTYTPKLPLIAVRPLPVRSYEAPMRGDTLFQFGMFVIASNCRTGTNRPADSVCAGIDELK